MDEKEKPTLETETVILMRKVVDHLQAKSREMAQRHGVNSTIVAMVASKLGLEIMQEAEERISAGFPLFLVDQLSTLMEGSGIRVQGVTVHGEPPKREEKNQKSGFNLMEDAFKKAGLKNNG